jgi:hypothetical protein
LLKLPNGITGFYHHQYEPPKMDGKQFRQLCFSLVHNNGGTVLDFKEPLTATNFFDIEVRHSKQQFHILLNAHYPFLAFASVVEFGQIQFIDIPELIELFSLFYRVLGTSELNERLLLNIGSKEGIIQNDNQLNSAELKQIAYWKPETIGELIFNFWD